MAISPDRRVLSLAEVERAYRLRHGTAGEDFRAGKLPGRKRGRAIIVSAKRAEELYGFSLMPLPERA